jgi:hypothetical protein
MPSKTEEYLALAQRTANGLTRYWESWTDYLTTASRLYKYSFPDQLMIYAQRPDATACADYDIWNNRMNRYVDEKHHEPEQDEEEKEDAPRRSVLAVLEEKAEKAEPVKPFKSYLDKDGDAR